MYEFVKGQGWVPVTETGIRCRLADMEVIVYDRNPGPDERYVVKRGFVDLTNETELIKYLQRYAYRQYRIGNEIKNYRPQGGYWTIVPV